MDGDRIARTRDAFRRSTAQARQLRSWSQTTRHLSDGQVAVWKRLRHQFLARADLQLTLVRQPNVAALESLDEIVQWLGTLRERLRLGRESNPKATETIVRQLEARYRRRRAELS